MISEKTLIKIPRDIRDEMQGESEMFKSTFTSTLDILSNEKEIKQVFTNLITQYLVSIDQTDVETYFKDHPEYMLVASWFIIKAIDLSFDKSDEDRYNISVLLYNLNFQVKFSHSDFNFAYDHFLLNSEIYVEDVPHLGKYLSSFISDSINQGCLNANYITHAEVYDTESET